MKHMTNAEKKRQMKEHTKRLKKTIKEPVKPRGKVVYPKSGSMAPGDT